MDVLKYVPFRVRNFFNRVVGGAGFNGERVSDIFAERDGLRRKYGELVETIEEVEAYSMNIQFDERKYRVQILLGGRDLDENVINNFGIDERALVDVAREEREERKKFIKQNEALERKHLEYVVRTICEDENVKRATAMVYCRGDIVYATNKFEKKLGSTYALENFLSKDERFIIDLEMGRRVEVEYGGGRLCFVPDKKGRSLVSVAYFIPNKRKDVVKIFHRVGEIAAKVIHDALRVEKFDKLVTT